MYIFKGTDNVGTYAFLNEVVSIADLVAYRNVLIINLVSSRKQPCRDPVVLLAKKPSSWLQTVTFAYTR